MDELAPALDEATCRAALVAPNLPPVVLEIFDGTHADGALSLTLGPPDYLFIPGHGLPPSIVPMWGPGTLITAFDPTDGLFKRFSLELPEHPTTFGPSFRDVAADLLVGLLELEFESEAVRQAAVALEYDGLDQLIDRLQLE